MNERKLKILYFTGNQKNWVKENWEYFKSELKKLQFVQVKFMSEGGNIQKIIKKIGFTPDFVFFDSMPHTKTLTITRLDQVGIPKGVLNVDLQWNPDFFKEFVKRNKIDLIFSVYRDAYFRFFPEFAKKLVWFPHHVNTAVFKDYPLEKRIDYLLMGAIGQKLYPLRTKIVHEMKGMRGFVYHEHPGYRYFNRGEKKKAFIGRNFAKEINRAKMFFADDSIYQYPIAKYYEVAACNTLLLASGSQELKDLGFINKETFVKINEDNYLKKAKYYLKHKNTRRKIAQRAYEMVRENHTTQIRVRQFADCIMRYLGWKSKLDKNSTHPNWVRLYEETPSNI